jgi:hypothetical protein
MRKVGGRDNRKAAPAIAAKISSAAAMRRNGDPLFRAPEAGFAFKLSDGDMLQPGDLDPRRPKRPSDAMQSF